MNSSAWDRIKELYAEALEREAGQRGAYLDSVCGDDAGLRRQVESLLAAEAEAGTFLSDLTRDASGGASHFLRAAVRDDAAPAETIGAWVGRYQLIEPLGEGGFGTVYRAQQTDPVRRVVALKVIKPGMDTRHVIARFEAERQALAMMEHPCIARVLDGGATEAARPYFVMELVEGAPITQYCERARLSQAARLALFLRVCDAVQHAHQKGIIHRDIKPSNVLVAHGDGEPTPKVIDFGVAKALYARLSEQTLTGAQHLVGTPAYMSPEQIESLADVDTRTDVYSLGVLLYEILTGALPFESRGLLAAGYSEMVRTIREVEPPRPSAHRAGLRGDLDWIVMKAIEKQRERRYETVAALALDVRRHLSDEPVVAGPPSATYRLSKFVRRHRGLLGASAGVLGALVVGLGLAVVGFVQASADRDRARNAELDAQREAREAETARQEAQAISDFLEEMLLQADPARAGKELQLSEVLDAAAERVERMPADQPAVEASIRSTIGRTYSMIGRYDDAMPHLRRALALRENLGGEHDGETLRARFQLAANLLLAGEFDEAEELTATSIEPLRAGEPEDQELLARNLDLVGRLKSRVSEYDAAEQAFSESLALFEGTTDGGGEIGRTLGALGSAMMHQGRYPEAEEKLREALSITQRVHGERSAHAAGILNNLAVTLRLAGKLDAAEAAYREALEIQTETHGEAHPATISTFMNLGTLLISRRDYAGAEEVLRASIDKVRAAHGVDSYQYAIAHATLSRALAGLNRLDEAEEAAATALAVCRRALGPTHEFVGTCLIDVGGLQMRRGDLDAAEASFAEALAVYQGVFGAEHPHIAHVLERLGEIEYRRGNAEAGADRLGQAMAMYEHVLGAQDREIADCGSVRAGLEREFGDVEAAVRLYREALALRESRDEGQSLSAFEDRRALGACLMQLERYDDAESELTAAYETAAAARGADDGIARTLAEALVGLYERWEKPDLAAEWRARLAEETCTRRLKSAAPGG